ncbi:MAG: hypothetical protein LH609_08215, partial [Rudanella sp.]|nr:hypothetical protein [Rudanella sp.]
FTTDSGISLSYGSSNKNGALVVVGTAAEPVKLVAYIAGIKGVWKGLALENGNIETSFKYCTIDGAGSVNIACGANYKAAIIFGNGCSDVGRGVMTNCVVSNSGGYGIAYRTGDSITLTSNTYSGNTKEDVYTFKQ